MSCTEPVVLSTTGKIKVTPAGPRSWVSEPINKNTDKNGVRKRGKRIHVSGPCPIGGTKRVETGSREKLVRTK